MLLKQVGPVAFQGSTDCAISGRRGVRYATIQRKRELIHHIHLYFVGCWTVVWVFQLALPR